MEGHQPLTFQWFKDGRQITSSAKLVIEHISGKMATLAIREVAAEDIGNYTCQVSNAGGSDKVTSDLVVTDFPRIQPFNFPKHEQMPKKVIVHCVVLDGSEPFKFTWLKDGVTLASNRKLQVKVLSETLSSLTILDVGAEDIGNYTCTVSNTAGSDKFTSELLVTGVPRIQPFSFPTNPPLGKDVAVSCFVIEGQQPLTFQWFKNDRRINTDVKLTIELVSGKMATLAVHQISAEDIGNYTCRVSNAAGSDLFTSELVLRSISDVPRLQPFLFPRHEQMPKKVIVHCVVLEGNEPFKFTWLKDGATLTNSRRLQVKVSEAVSSLTIVDLNAEDIGNYTCVVTNAAGSDSFTSQLLVTGEFHQQNIFFPYLKTCYLLLIGQIQCSIFYPASRSRCQICFICRSPEPPRVQQFSFPENPTLKTKVVVSCVATGDEPLSFAWSKEGRLLTTGQRIIVSILSANIASLTISQVTAEDIGNYTCVASNKAGKDSFTSSLVINDAVPPKLQPLYLPREHPLMEALVVSCIAIRGTPPLEFSWFKDGQPVTQRAVPRMFSDTLSTLTIPKVGAEDLGNYTCRASNAIGSDSYTAALMVTGQSYFAIAGLYVPKIQPFNFPKNHPLNKKVVVSCVAMEGDEPLSFAWLKDGRSLSSGKRVLVAKLTENMASLTILEVTAEDIGNYTCVASNNAGRDSYSSPLILASSNPGVPKLQPFNFPNQEQMPKKVVVHCVVLEGNEPFKFTWLKDGVTLTSNRRLQIKVSEAVSSLAISEVSAEDIGNYTCVVHNAAGSDSFMSQLLSVAKRGVFHIAEAPRLQPFYFPKEHPLTETLVVSCIATRGTPPLVFSWFKDGRPVNSAHGVVSKMITESISTLAIPRVGANTSETTRAA
ncbi:unnamed protein product [Ixodes hexagonus]